MLERPRHPKDHDDLQTRHDVSRTTTHAQRHLRMAPLKVHPCATGRRWAVRSNRAQLRASRVTLSSVNVILRLRWLSVLGYGVCVAVITTALQYASSGVLSHSLYFGVCLGGVLAALTRWQTVTVMDEGLLVAGGYGGFFCPWSEVAVERRQFGPLSLDQLRLRKPVRRYTRGSATGPPEFTWRPTRSKRLFIGMWDRNWRAGSIGAALTAHGASLEGTAPTGAVST